MPAARPFKNIVLCSTGDLPEHDDKIKRWVEYWGGKFTKEISPQVTHLVSSGDAFKNNIDVVRQARKISKVKIVKYLWLESSLLGKRHKPLPTPEFEFGQLRLTRRTARKYSNLKASGGKRRKESSSPETSINTWLQVRPPSSSAVIQSMPSSLGLDKSPIIQTEELSQVDIHYTKIKKYGGSLDHISAQSELEGLKSGYHLYRDPLTNFKYSINLVRKDILTKCLERHRMKVRYGSVPLTSTQHSRSMSSRHGSTSSHHGLAHTYQLPVHQPIFFFPHTSPFSACPCIPSSLPPGLKYRLNPDLRIPVPNPWAQNIQILESDTPTLLHGRLQLTYMAFSKYLTINGDVFTVEICREGSTLELAMLCFQTYFKNRCAGIDWVSRGDAVAPKEFGVDGTGYSPQVRQVGRWYYDPTAADVYLNGDGAGALKVGKEGKELKPCVTMLLSEESAGSVVSATARTPEGGW